MNYRPPLERDLEWLAIAQHHGMQTRLLERVLDSCGINYASIYPDLTGLARHIYWRYKWGMRQTKSPPRHMD